AHGSLVERNGKVVGSRLAAQGFASPRYFHERPSATAPAYNAGATTFANLGPTNPDLAKNVRAQIAAILKLERPYNPHLTAGGCGHPRRRRPPLGRGQRPRHLAGLRAAAGAPHRGGPPPAAGHGPAPDLAEHGRPQPRGPRRARRERARAQPRPGQGAPLMA